MEPASPNEHTEVTHEFPDTSTRTDSGVPTVAQLGVALAILGIVFGISYIPDIQRKYSEDTPAHTTQASLSETREARTEHFATVSIEAQAAYVWDVKNQRALYNKNAGVQLPLASLTKLMTALVAHEHLNNDVAVVVPTEAIFAEGDSGLRSGQQFGVTSLIDLTLISSSNDGAHALAAAAGSAIDLDTEHETEVTKSFLDRMNRRAEDIGLSQTYFTNPTGLDATAVRSGSYGSARDMAFLMEYILVHQPEILEGTTNQSLNISDETGVVLTATNTNEIAEKIPGLIGSKTGFTTLAGGNLVIAFDVGLNHPIVIAVLGSSREGRFEDVAALVEATQKTFTQN